MALNKFTDLKYNSNTTRVGTDLKYTVYTKTREIFKCCENPLKSAE